MSFPRNSAPLIKQLGLMTLGCLVYSLGQVIFIRPMMIPLGGMTGIALIINYLTGLPVGAMHLALNIPTLLLGYKTLGRQFFLKTVYSTVIVSVLMDAIGPGLSAAGFAYQAENPLLSALAGGAIMGCGMGLIFRQGGTAGGAETISKYINKKSDRPVGNVNFYINAAVLLSSMLFYAGLDSVLYGFIAIFISNSVVDRIVYGADVEKYAFIITDKPTQVADEIMARLGSSVTAWVGKGMYTGEPKAIIMCAVHRYDSSLLKQALRQADPHAVLMLGEINEIFGVGFKNLG